MQGLGVKALTGLRFGFTPRPSNLADPEHFPSTRVTSLSLSVSVCKMEIIISTLPISLDSRENRMKLKMRSLTR